MAVSSPSGKMGYCAHAFFETEVYSILLMLLTYRSTQEIFLFLGKFSGCGSYFGRKEEEKEVKNPSV
jgi:hypothetical protein